MKYYIKERHNPQFGKPYYVPLGKISKAAALRHEKAAYGSNNVIEYDTLEDYNTAIETLTKLGFKVHT